MHNRPYVKLSIRPTSGDRPEPTLAHWRDSGGNTPDTRRPAANHFEGLLADPTDSHCRLRNTPSHFWFRGQRVARDTSMCQSVSGDPEGYVIYVNLVLCQLQTTCPDGTTFTNNNPYQIMLPNNTLGAKLRNIRLAGDMGGFLRLGLITCCGFRRATLVPLRLNASDAVISTRDDR